MAKTYKPFLKDGACPVSNGASDLEFEGEAKLLEGDLNINGQKVVISIGDNDVNFENL